MTNILKIPNNRVRSPGKMLQHEHCDVADAKRVNLVSPDGSSKVDVIKDPSGKNRLAVDVLANFGDVNVDIAHPNVCEIQNHIVVTANVEFSLDLPDKTKRFIATIRDCNSIMQVACNTGETGTFYRKVPMGVEYNSGEVDLPDSSKVFIRVSKAGAVVELESWFVS